MLGLPHAQRSVAARCLAAAEASCTPATVSLVGSPTHSVPVQCVQFHEHIAPHDSSDSRSESRPASRIPGTIRSRNPLVSMQASVELTLQDMRGGGGGAGVGGGPRMEIAYWGMQLMQQSPCFPTPLCILM